MDFRTFYNSMTEVQKAVFAESAETTANYISTHFMSDPPRRVPRPELMVSLIRATNGKVSRQEMLDHFYPITEVA